MKVFGTLKYAEIVYFGYFWRKWPIHKIGQYWRLQQFQKNRPRFLSSPWTILLISTFIFRLPKHVYGTAVRSWTKLVSLICVAILLISWPF